MSVGGRGTGFIHVGADSLSSGSWYWLWSRLGMIGDAAPPPFRDDEFEVVFFVLVFVFVQFHGSASIGLFAETSDTSVVDRRE